MCLKTIEIKNVGSVPCGKCNECLRRRKNDWAFRLAWESKVAKTAVFITLTYNENQVPYGTDGKIKVRSLKREHLIRFHKSIRMAIDRYFNDLGCEKPDYEFRYYSVGEYGTKTKRPHYHSIMFNVPDEVVKRIPTIWGRGFTSVGTVTNDSINYTAKYLIDKDDRTSNQPIERPFSIMSKRLGFNYLNSNGKWHKGEDEPPEDWVLFVYNNKYKSPLPRYYKEKIFNESEREIIGEILGKRARTEHVKLYEEKEKEFEKELPTGKRVREMKEHKNLSIKHKSQFKNTL